MTNNQTMKARLLRLLKQRWVTPIDALHFAGCLSLSQRCGGFKRAGYVVQDKWVHLGSGKRVKCYRILSQPK